MRRGAARGAVFGCLIAVAACNGELRFDDDKAALEAGAPVDGSAPPTPDGGAEDGEVTPQGCTLDGDCKLASLQCDTVSGACVECTGDAQCTRGDARRCDAALHRCVQCGIDGDCGSEQKCEQTTRRCVATCDTLIGTCRDGTYICELDRGICVRCHLDFECLLPGNERICDSANGKCVECVRDDQCSKGKPRCDRTRGQCAACLGPDDCAGGSICDPASHSCVTP